MSNTWDNKIFTGAWVDGGAGTLEVKARATGDVIATIGQAAHTAPPGSSHWLSSTASDGLTSL